MLSLGDISPKDAYKILQKDPRAVLIDIRSDMEFLFVGHPISASHIPWINEPDWVINPHFTAEVRKLLLGNIICSDNEHCATIILICRSGNRSLEAGKKLLAEGLKNIFHIDSGFEGKLNDDHHRSSINGWRFDGLPWNQC
jgi:rhodanese-related sulfurtransferase